MGGLSSGSINNAPSPPSKQKKKTKILRANELLTNISFNYCLHTRLKSDRMKWLGALGKKDELCPTLRTESLALGFVGITKGRWPNKLPATPKKRQRKISKT